MLQIDHLFEHPQQITTVARWIHGEFWAETNVHTPDSLERLLRQAADPDRIPLSLIAFFNGTPVGTVNLVANDDDQRTHLYPWLAALFVVPHHRRQGVGTELVSELANRAAGLGIRTLYLGTDNPGFYRRVGAAIHEQVTDKFAIMRLGCPTPHSVAMKFSKSLDADDFEAALQTLSPNCEYAFRGELIQSPDAIIHTYRVASEKAKCLFDRIEYKSEITEIGPDRVVVKFCDRLETHGQSHDYCSKQQLSFGPDGRIVRIDHDDIPGEREALDGFLEKWKPLK
jgi:predicted N-acetyltransferase YhbS